MKRKTVYISPVTEVLLMRTENLLNPNTWNPDAHHGGSDMGIIEGDPEGDGKGAKEFNPYAFLDIDWDNNDLWGDDSEGLWD